LSGPGLSVLIADDDEVDRQRVRRMFSKADIAATCVEVAEPLEALALLRRMPFDLVMLDFHFPTHDGMVVLRELRESGSNVPVIVLTGHDDSQLAVELMKNGATDYIAKGALTSQRLATSVRHALRIRASEVATMAVQEALRSAEELIRGLLAASGDCIEVLDANGQVLLMSPAGLRHLEAADVGQVRGRRWDELWSSHPPDLVSQALADARAGHTARFVGVRPAGAARFEVRISPLPGSAGAPGRLLAVARELGR
jgi:FixJ family two-component response regulator